MSQHAYRHTEGEIIMQSPRKQVEIWIDFYTDIIKSAPNVRKVLQDFDGKQINKRLFDALGNAVDKQKLKLLVNSEEEHFDLEYRKLYHSNCVNLALFRARGGENPAWTKIIGKTARLNAAVVIEAFDADIEKTRKRIDDLNQCLETIEDTIAEHNKIIERQNEMLKNLPFEIRSAYGRKIERVMYLYY